MIDSNIFPAGCYIVLLSTCNGLPVWELSMPINYCYKLASDSSSNGFSVELDARDCLYNGWTAFSGNTNNKLKLRLATPDEIAEYKRVGKPYDVTKLHQIKNNYQIF